MEDELKGNPRENVGPDGAWSDELAEWYVDKFGEHPNCELAVQAAGLKGSETVLDIGCGSGAAVRATALKTPDGMVVGLDPTPAMIRIARELSRTHIANGRLRFHQAAAENLPLDSDSIDVVFAICSLHHWSSVPGGLAEVVRVLKPQGRVVIVEDIFDEPERGMSAQEIRQALETAGLDIVEVGAHVHGEICANLLVARAGGS